jgi:hypothetical protein
MFNQKIVQEALKRTCLVGKNHDFPNENIIGGEDSEISLMIHDIFGGEILKTHKKNGWHFYNRIEGRRIDFTRLITNRYSNINPFEDIPATPAETYNYIATEDYSTFFMRFVRAFEEAVGLKSTQKEYAA